MVKIIELPIIILITYYALVQQNMIPLSWALGVLVLLVVAGAIGNRLQGQITKQTVKRRDELQTRIQQLENNDKLKDATILELTGEIAELKTTIYRLQVDLQDAKDYIEGLRE